MSWYKNTITKYIKKNIGGMVFTILFSLIILLWCFMRGESFEWKKLEPISQPSIFYKMLYSALVFISLGAFLYWIKFYVFLHWLIVGCFGDWKLYRDFKRLIWGGLMFLMYFVIVPWVVDLLNTIICFFYNVFSFIIYLHMPLGVALIVAVLFIVFKKNLKIR